VKRKSKQIQSVDGRGVTTPSQSVKKGGAVTTAIACSLYPLAWQTCLRKEEAMSKDVEHKNLREQIMFHLSFSLMMKFSGRDEMAQEHMQKCQDLIELIPDITIKHAKKEYDKAVEVGMGLQ
tara:strand:- start:14 stop:379 length:366 start_codon:yes stop_codon:yes gene_type:complete